MKLKLFSVLLVLLLAGGCGAKTADADAEPIPPATVTLELKDAGKTDAKFYVSVDWRGGIPSGYGWVLYSSAGGYIKNGESAMAAFTVDGLKPGSRYYLSAWAQTGDDRMLCESQVAIDTDPRYDKVVAKGIDVSRWQGDIDWQSVASDGIEFAILRIGYSGGIDMNFEQYYEGATNAGLDVGVYLYSYALTEAEAMQDAKDILAQLDGRRLDYPIYYDIEDESQNHLDSKQLTALAEAFCKEIAVSDYIPGVYTNLYMYSDRLDGAALADKYDMWIAATDEQPPEFSNFQMVQHSHTGSVAGIKGDVDLNVAFKAY